MKAMMAHIFESNNSWGPEFHLDLATLNSNLFQEELELIPDDPFEQILNTDDSTSMKSIHSDCKEIESGGSSSSSDESFCSDSYESIIKYEMRNHDCMWSGQCIINPDGTLSCGYRSSARQLQNEQKIYQHNIFRPVKDIENIPPGTSLLINPRPNQMKKFTEKFRLQASSMFSKERESPPIIGIPRPDTPVSLDNDPPDFKHCVDLSACLMGSNNISLGCEDKMIISKLKEQLEDSTIRDLDIKNIIPGNKKRTLSEVLNVINSVENENSLCDDTDSDDLESTNSSVLYKGSEFNESNEKDYYTTTVMHSDHSYTRSKGGVDIMGLETPSDSDEEIDVVSLVDKKLPTNPSDKERRVIQNKVAHKISSRFIKTTGGVRTLLPRRRGSLDPPFSVTPTKQPRTVATSKYTSPISTPYSISSGYSVSSSTNGYVTMQGRKRNSTASSAKDEYLPPSKRYRLKNKRANKKHSDMLEANTIERRHLHNNMERQRRISLKNLFEALKNQVPSIKDKERAPKVTILKEATKLCEQLTIEDRRLTNQKLQLQAILRLKQVQKFPRDDN